MATPSSAKLGQFSMTLGSTKPAAPARNAPVGGAFDVRGRKRRAAGAGNDGSDDDDDDDDTFSKKVQLVSGFDAMNGAVPVDGGADGKGGKGVLVIPAIKNKDWRLESRKRKATYLPPEAHTRPGGGSEDHSEVVGGELEPENASRYGLQILKKKKKSTEEDDVNEDKGEGRKAKATDTTDLDTVMTNAGGSDKENFQTTPTVSALEKPKTEDELALEALLAGEDGTKKKSDLVLAMQSADGDWREGRGKGQVLNEEDAYKVDIASRPDAPSLEDYEAVPVEEFGAALLRGMGWKEGQELGKRGGEERKQKKVEKRPAFLGLGAKATSVAEELGSWGKGAKGKRGYVDKTYNPVVLKNKSTGEIVDNIPNKKDEGRSRGAPDSDPDYYRRKETPSRDDRRRNRSVDEQDSRRRRDRDGRYEKRPSGRDRSRDQGRGRDQRERDHDRDLGGHENGRLRERDYDDRRDSGREVERNRDRDYRRDKGRDVDRNRDRRRSSKDRGSRR